MYVCMLMCEETTGLTAELAHFFQSHGRNSYTAVVQLLTLLILSL